MPYFYLWYTVSATCFVNYDKFTNPPNRYCYERHRNLKITWADQHVSLSHCAGCAHAPAPPAERAMCGTEDPLLRPMPSAEIAGAELAGNWRRVPAME